MPIAKYPSSSIWIIVTNEKLKFTMGCQTHFTETIEVEIRLLFEILYLNNICIASNKYQRLPGQFGGQKSNFEISDT